MAISKKLAAIFAGVLLAGSFGLAGCDDTMAKDPNCNITDSIEYAEKTNNDTYCFGNSNIHQPGTYITQSEYEKYKDLFDEWCTPMENDAYDFKCRTNIEEGSLGDYTFFMITE